MARVELTDPWPRMRDIVAAVVTGLHGGRFMEETLEALCLQLGASSAWSTLKTKGGGGPLHRSRTASFRGVSPAVLAQHVDGVLEWVQKELKTIGGPVPYADEGSFAAVPLWSHPRSSKKGRSYIGSMYMEFPGDQGTRPLVLEFVECVGELLGGVIAQQTLIEDTREDLRVERARDHNEHHMRLDDLLAPDSMADIRDELTAAISGNASIMILGDPVIEARHLDLGIPAADPRPSAPSVPADSQTRDGIQARWRQLSDQKSGLDAIEKAIVEDALRASGGIVARTARTLSVPRTGLISRMATLEIDPERFKET